MLSLLNPNNMRYRIAEKEGLGFIPQYKRWWWPWWTNFFDYVENGRGSFPTIDEAKKIIEHRITMRTGYTKIHYLSPQDESK